MLPSGDRTESLNLPLLRALDASVEGRMTVPKASKEEFDLFIANWRRERLSSLTESDMEGLGQARAHELNMAALKAGHSAALRRACKSYRTMMEYLRALHDVQETTHFKD